MATTEQKIMQAYNEGKAAGAVTDAQISNILAASERINDAKQQSWSEAESILRALLSAAPADHVRGVTEMVVEARPVSVPDGWEAAIEEVRKGIYDDEPSAFDRSGYREYAGVVLDAVADKLHALAAVPTPQEAKPVAADGWVRVPITPTLDMEIAFAEQWYSKRRAIDDCEMSDCYDAMLAAAPQQPAPAVGADALNLKRYEWLRNEANQWHEDDISVSDSSFNTYFGEELDAAIDAAIALQAGEQS